MYLPKPSKLVALLAFFLFFACMINAQVSLCELTSPDNIILNEDNNSHYLSWDAKMGANSYRVVVVDNELGTILFDHTTTQESITLDNIFFTPDIFVGIASVCSAMEAGAFEYFAPAAASNIFVQDIVMQMEGEPEPRTMECDVEKTQLLSAVFEGDYTGNAEVVPPYNPSPGHQIEGALVYVNYYREADEDMFAQSTTLALSGGKILHAANQINVAHEGRQYQYVAPMTTGLYEINSASSGSFDYDVATTTPYPEEYHLEVELRFCYNVKKADRNEDGNNSGFGLMGQETNPQAMAYRMERITEQVGLSVYPNPANDRIQLSQQAEHITIRNARGQVVLQLATLAAQRAIEIDEWTPGIYFLEMSAADGTRKTLRFIKN